MNYSWFNNLIAITIRSLTLAAKFLLLLSIVHYFHLNDLGQYGIISALIAYTLFFLGVEFYNYSMRILVDASSIQRVLVIRDQFILYSIIFVITLPFIYLLFKINYFPKNLYLWFLVIVVLEHASNELMRILIALGKPNGANIVFFIRQGLWVYFLLLLFFFYPNLRNMDSIFIAWISGAALSIFIALYMLRFLPWYLIYQHPINWLTIFYGIKISRPFLISAFCALGLLYLERFFINYYCGLAAVGIYTFYSGLSITIHTLVNTGVSKMRLAPLVNAWKTNDSYQFYTESMYLLKYTVFFVLFFALISVLLIHPLIIILNKNLYLVHIKIFYILLLSAICRSIADVPLYCLYAQHEDNLLLWINLLSFLCMLIGNIIFVPQYGMKGAAISSVIASFVFIMLFIFIDDTKNYSSIFIKYICQG